jgi:hypothetical protein
MKNMKNSNRINQNVSNFDKDSPQRSLKIMQGSGLSYATGIELFYYVIDDIVNKNSETRKTISKPYIHTHKLSTSEVCLEWLILYRSA